MFSYISHLECPKCAETYSADQVINLCSCGSPLLVRYSQGVLKAQWKKENLTSRDANLWRYHELLPVRSADHIVSLGEGWTPLLPLSRLGKELGLERFYLNGDQISGNSECCVDYIEPGR